MLSAVDSYFAKFSSHLNVVHISLVTSSNCYSSSSVKIIELFKFQYWIVPITVKLYELSISNDCQNFGSGSVDNFDLSE